MQAKCLKITRRNGHYLAQFLAELLEYLAQFLRNCFNYPAQWLRGLLLGTSLKKDFGQQKTQPGGLGEKFPATAFTGRNSIPGAIPTALLKLPGAILFRAQFLAELKLPGAIPGGIDITGRNSYGIA